MHSKAVDYQKHGELLDVEEFEKIKDKNKFFADFMTQDMKILKKDKIQPSPGVLGQLFRKLDQDIDIETFLKIEYQYKIECNYRLPEDTLDDLTIFQHLEFLYKNVVKPYSAEIHKIMEEKSLFTESDIFNINCAFSNLVNARDEKYGHEDDIEIILLELKEQLRYIQIERYAKEFKKQKKGSSGKIIESIYKALKFCSYFELHHLNSFNSSIFESKEEDPDFKVQEKQGAKEHFEKFVKIFKRDKEIENSPPISFKKYVEVVTANQSFAEEQELEEVIQKTKILSAWWLLTQYK